MGGESPLVLLAAGGTGGHLFPAEALASALRQRGIEVDLATDERATRYGHDFPARETHVIPSATIRGRDPISMAKTVVTLGLGAMKALRLMRRIRPAAVVGFGGYPTLPPMLAATLRRIPTVIHDANAVMGRANRMLGSARQRDCDELSRHDARCAARREGELHRQSGAADGDRRQPANPIRRSMTAARSSCSCSAAARARA